MGRDPILQSVDELTKQLGDARTEAQGLVKRLGELRAESMRLRRLILERMDQSYDEKTPVRPPSQQAMEAFQSSSDFLRKKT